MFFQMDARRIPFEDEFDVIGAFDVIEHIEEDEIVLRQMHQATKPGGGIVITVPQHRWLWSKNDKVSGHRRRYRRDELKDKVWRAGFEVVATKAFVALPLPLLVWSRLVRKIKGPDDWSEFKISAMTNWCLDNVLSVERCLIRAGFSFPVGGSLLLAARKLG